MKIYEIDEEIRTLLNDSMNEDGVVDEDSNTITAFVSHFTEFAVIAKYPVTVPAPPTSVPVPPTSTPVPVPTPEPVPTPAPSPAPTALSPVPGPAPVPSPEPVLPTTLPVPPETEQDTTWWPFLLAGLIAVAIVIVVWIRVRRSY